VVHAGRRPSDADPHGFFGVIDRNDLASRNAGCILDREREGAVQQVFDGLASSLYGRGLAKLKKGDTADGDADISAAKAIEAKIVEEFARYGVQ